MKITITFFVLILLLANHGFGQQNEFAKKPRIAGIKFGATTSSFYRDSKDKFLPPSTNPNLGFHFGFILDLINKKRFGSQLELSYVLKGASETFQSATQTTKVKTKLHYAQLDIIPIIVKPFGYRPFNPYVSIGFYYSYLLSPKIDYTVERELNGIIFTDNEKPLDFKLFEKSDYGLFANAGIKFKSISVEYRHEFGLKDLISEVSLKNQINNLSLKLTY